MEFGNLLYKLGNQIHAAVHQISLSDSLWVQCCDMHGVHSVVTGVVDSEVVSLCCTDRQCQQKQPQQ